MTTTAPLTSSTALLSPCGRYRYELRRVWGPGELALWVALNPSTADGVVNDPTVIRMVGFSRQFGYDGMILCNTHGLRATNPECLRQPDEWPPPASPDWRQFLEDPDAFHGEPVPTPPAPVWDPVGPDNDRVLADAALEAAVVICAWGANPLAENRVSKVLGILRHNARPGVRITCLGATRTGAPRHPLYLRNTTVLTPYPTC